MPTNQKYVQISTCLVCLYFHSGDEFARREPRKAKSEDWEKDECYFQEGGYVLMVNWNYKVLSYNTRVPVMVIVLVAMVINLMPTIGGEPWYEV